MALIKCPECGKEISDKAIACPECGAPFRNEKEIINKVNLFIAINHSYFPQHTIPIITNLLTMNPDKTSMAMYLGYKNPTTAFFLSSFLRIGRFYIGEVGLNIFIYLSCILCLIMFDSFLPFLLYFWGMWFIDILTIKNDTRKRNYNKLMKFLSANKRNIPSPLTNTKSLTQ